MQRLPTVLLHHTTLQGDHYDWLLADPDLATGTTRVLSGWTALDDRLLWSVRVRFPSEHWPSIKRWALTPIPHHRRRYLNYQGPISGDRGWVRRVDQGWFTPRLWTGPRKVLELTFQRCRGMIHITHRSPTHLDAVWMSDLP